MERIVIANPDISTAARVINPNRQKWDARRGLVGHLLLFNPSSFPNGIRFQRKRARKKEGLKSNKFESVIDGLW
jgi:hypothetical protein